MNTLRRANRRVEYFGCEIFVPLSATHLACDSNGDVNAFNAQPEFSEDMRLFWGHSLGCVAEFDLDAEFDCISSVVEIGNYFDCVEDGVDMSGFIMIGAIEIDEQEDVSFIIGQSIDTGNEGPLGGSEES